MKSLSWKVLGLPVMAIIATTAVSVAALANGNIPGGAVSGGGGGTLPANPITIFEVERIVKNAKLDLRLLIKHMQATFQPKYKTSAQEKIFLGPKTIFDVLEETGYELRKDKPCYDDVGNEVDGSIFATESENICLSAFRIAPKLIEERARIEILALVVHELSHKLGTTEAEAVVIQQEVALRLKGTTDTTTRYLPALVHQEAGMLSSDLDSIANLLAAAKPDLPAINLLSQTILTKEDGLRHHIIYRNDQFEFYNFREGQWYGLQSHRLRLIEIYLQTVAASREVDRNYAQKAYDRIFNGQTSMTYRDYLDTEMSNHDENEFGTEMLYRIEDFKAAVAELKSLAKVFAIEAEYYFNFDMDLTMWRHASAPRIAFNPFRQFEGSYQLVNPTCAVSGNMKTTAQDLVNELKITAVPGHAEKMKLERKWLRLGMTAIDDLVDGQPLMVLGGSIGTMSGSDKASTEFGEVRSEFGTRWGDHLSNAVHRIEKRSGKLFYVEEMKTRNAKMTGGFEDGSYQCEAELVH